MRAAVFTALCVTLSAGAHVLLSGEPVPVTLFLAVAAGVFLVAFALADRERGFAGIAALLVPLELTADTIFTTGQHACYGQAGGPVTGPLRSVGVDLLCGGGGVGTPLARMAAQSGGTGPVPPGTAASVPWLLLVAHLAVGLLAACWLRRGEAAVARLLRAAAAAAFRPLRLALAICRAETTARPGAAPRTPLVRAPRALPLLSYSVHRRGPPALGASAV
ncbi:hypothetical protein G5C65_20130 [Streptomyces sp. SB3404]|uniref:Integral membrane protein n=1 Tax=Streptomyces boncukensis TaxID=2711219 RepID=A0A6G4WZR0_9ACTN|nr:hypothetical protein [Streptomyces boncukensis]